MKTINLLGIEFQVEPCPIGGYMASCPDYPKEPVEYASTPRRAARYLLLRLIEDEVLF